jgi:hypothetical protein
LGFVAGVKAEEVEGSATKAQGFHAEHMLIVFEEMPGIGRAVATAFENTCRAPHNLRLAVGNPDHQLDPLHQFCHGPRTVPIRISAYDHPNVVCRDPSMIPGAVTEQGIADALAKAEPDGGAENRMFKSRVRGISPDQAADALIRLEWIERSNARWQAAKESGTLEGWGKTAYGVDVANSEAGDQAAIAYGKGRVLVKVEAFACPDANRLGADVAHRMGITDCQDACCGVDTVGVGAGCFNELARLKRYVRPLNGGASPEYDHESSETFANLRAQMHWRLREDLLYDRVDLPADAQLTRDLMTPTWEPKNGKIYVEAKEAIKKHLPGGRSPNVGDACVYWNFVRDRTPLMSPVVKFPKTVGGDPVFVRKDDALVFDPSAAAGSGDNREDEVPGSITSRGGQGW